MPFIDIVKLKVMCFLVDQRLRSFHLMALYKYAYYYYPNYVTLHYT